MGETYRKGPSPQPPFPVPPPGSSLQLLLIEPAAPSLCSPLLWRAGWVGSSGDPSLGEEVLFPDSDKISPRSGRVSLSAWTPRDTSAPRVWVGAPGPHETLQRALCLGGHAWFPWDAPARPVSEWGRLVPEGHSSVPGVSEGAPDPQWTLQRAPCLGGHAWSPRDTPARPEGVPTELLNRRGQDGVRTTEHPRRHQPCAALLRLRGHFPCLGQHLSSPHKPEFHGLQTRSGES